MNTSFGFDLKSLEIFVQIVDTGSMTRAGQRLGMSQSSVSQALAGLETSLRVELLDRSVRPMELSGAGRYFYDRAQSLLQEARLTSQEMRKADYNMLRHVRLAMVDSIISAVGKSLVDVVRQRTQSWSMITGQSHLHAHMLVSRQADIIISDDPVDTYDELLRHPILREPFVLAVPNDYDGGSDLEEVIREYDFIRYSATSLIAQDIERYLRRNQFEPAQRLQLDNSFAVVSAVSSGIGCTVTSPLCLFQSGIRQHGVKLLPLPEPFYRSITLVARQHELGDLPGMIAGDCRRILDNSFRSEITDEYEWLRNEIETG